SARPSLGPTHDAMVGKRLRRIGFAVIAASLASFAAIEVVILASVMPTQYAGALKRLVFLIISLLFIGFFISSRGRQYLARADSAEPDPRPPVVLLRPFQSDAYGKD